jgi:4-azaleucine resistance transporter AzlC
MKTSTQAFWAGVRAEFPLLIGVFPFGLIYGVLGLNAGLSNAAAQAMSAVVFAGSAQFVAVQLVHETTPGLIIALTIAIVNLRHLLYSASVAPYLQDLSPRWKSLLAYLLTDEAYAITITYYDREGQSPVGHWFFLGAGLTLWVTWQVSTAAGVFLGATVPADWPLDFTLALTFIALLVPTIKDRPSLAAALSAGAVAVLAYPLPYKLGLILAALTGITLGVWLERRR